MSKVAGVDVLLKVEVDGELIPLGGQKGASLSRSANTIDVTDKNSNGWSESMAGVKSWSVDAEGFVVLGNEAFEHLNTAFEGRSKLKIEIRVGASDNIDGYTLEGDVVITDFPEEYNQDDAVSFSLSLQGASPLVRNKGAKA